MKTAMLSGLLLLLVGCAQTVLSAAETPVPRLAGDYVPIYQPRPDVYIGRTTAHFTNGVTYAEWRPNDHTFIKGPDRRWHCFGITKPEGPAGAGDCHEAEGTTFHAVAPEGDFADVAFKPDAWRDAPKFHVGDCGWAPFILRVAEGYAIVGSSLGWATSPDLYAWTNRGPLKAKGKGRDASIFRWNGTNHLYRCAGNGVSLIVSTNLTDWSEPVEVFKPSTASFQCESPSVVAYAEKFYLFWCLWDTLDPIRCAYCPRTFVHVSDTPAEFRGAPLVAELQAHAPEIFQDEAGRWYISSADHPRRGVQVAPLSWEPPASP